MRRFVVSAAAVAALLANSSFGQAPSNLTHYRFLRSSTLTETGGFAGVDIDYRVFGMFDFVNPLLAPNVDAPFAKFANVNAWASHPILAYVKPLDQALNLSGLKGEPLATTGWFDAFRFTGRTQDDSSVEIFTFQQGPWMYLRGTTTAPPGSADYFEYSFKAIARKRPFADFTSDDVVTASDLAQWKSHFGASPATLQSNFGDANEDGVIDGNDLLAWQSQVGETAPEFSYFEA
jgi:hypothetical protein